ncbi:MAG: hypothetical protein JWN20_2728 [Jatrophihabitantaceae bacterium]|nr:hypothetical protein [Jatrophihabitantaceae bacterium]
MPPERLGRWIDGFAQRHGGLSVVRGPEVVHLAGPDGAQAWITVPFPPLVPGSSGPALGDGPRELAYDPVDDLIAHVVRPRRIGVILVRRGGHASGVFEGPALLSSKVGSRYVQGTTKAGGWSQQRYARRRANQSRAAFDDAADEAVRIVLPHAASLDAVVTGGDRGGVDAVLADPRLAPLRALVTGPLMGVADPRLRVLEASPALFLAVAIALDP